MTGGLVKEGMLEVAVPATCCGILWSIGQSWAEGLILAAGLLFFSAIAACIVNFCSLQAERRAALLSCILLPYSTLMVIVPYGLMLPGIERVERDAATQSKTEPNNSRNSKDGTNE